MERMRELDTVRLKEGPEIGSQNSCTWRGSLGGREYHPDWV